MQTDAAYSLNSFSFCFLHIHSLKHSSGGKGNRLEDMKPYMQELGLQGKENGAN